MRKKRNISKILIVPNFGCKTLEIRFDNKKRIVLLSSFILLISLFSYSFYRYNFYKTQVLSLLNDNTVAVSSINQMSTDEIRIRKELIKLKTELQAVESFLADVSLIDQEVKRNLKIKYSSVTFADLFAKNVSVYDRAHPASIAKTTSDTEDSDKLVKESQERQKSYKKLMEATPSGYPVQGNLVNAKNYIKGKGVVIAVPYGTFVKATADGKVKEVKEIGDKIFLIEIEHPSNNEHTIITRYLFLQNPLVYVGKEVNKGQIIAYSGFYPESFDNLVGYQLIVDNILVQP